MGNYFPLLKVAKRKRKTGQKISSQVMNLKQIYSKAYFIFFFSISDDL